MLCKSKVLWGVYLCLCLCLLFCQYFVVVLGGKAEMLPTLKAFHTVPREFPLPAPVMSEAESIREVSPPPPSNTVSLHDFWPPGMLGLPASHIPSASISHFMLFKSLQRERCGKEASWPSANGGLSSPDPLSL